MDNGQEADAVLMACSRFALGGTGYAGSICPAQRAAETLVKANNIATLTFLLDHASLPGRLYALWGLKFVDHAGYVAARTQFETSTESVESQGGCCVHISAVTTLLPLIDRYKF